MRDMKSNKGSFKIRYDKSTKSFEECKNALIKYLESRPYIDKIEYPSLCKKFELPFIPSIFRKVYYRRVVQLFRDNEPLTIATVNKMTKIPHKYLCQVKRQLEKHGYIKVRSIGQCPTTGSPSVQFVTITTKGLNYE
jgi:hypothetical protein